MKFSIPVFCLCSLFVTPLFAQGTNLVPQDQIVPLPTIADIWKEEPIEVGLQKQLFVDDYLISHKYNIERDLNQATKENNGKPLLVREKEWEIANLFQVNSVHYMDDRFIMHYGYTGPVDYCCRVESTDGIHWTRTELGEKNSMGADNNLLDYQGCGSSSIRMKQIRHTSSNRFSARWNRVGLPHAVCVVTPPMVYTGKITF
ncbi:MAG: hypothetical protein R3C11_10550 [Planctomycetaceae bacterium]